MVPQERVTKYAKYYKYIGLKVKVKDNFYIYEDWKYGVFEKHADMSLHLDTLDHDSESSSFCTYR
jgi:hypothetical protein